MTAQLSDGIRLGRKVLSIQGVRGEGLFDPSDLDWEVQSISSACWRGYKTVYGLSKGRLVLNNVDIRFREGSLPSSGVFFKIEIDGKTRAFRRSQAIIGNSNDSDVPMDIPRTVITFDSDRFIVYPSPNGPLSDGDTVEISGRKITMRIVDGDNALASCVLPELNGCSGTYGRFSSDLVRFRKAKYPIEFDGGILACSRFIKELYVHMGFHPAWKFRNVEELIFEKGRLVHRENVSTKLAEVREAMKRESLGPEKDSEIGAWVERCFRLDY